MIKNFKKYLFKFIATFGFVGYFPLCPGTASSLVALIIFYFLPAIKFYSMMSFLVCLFFLGIWTSTRVAENMHKHDPSVVVIDEVLGVGVSLLAVPKTFWFYLLAFIVFRFFDVSKVYPINRLEKVRGGWGIMLDDLLSGLFTCFVVQTIIFLLIKS